MKTLAKALTLLGWFAGWGLLTSALAQHWGSATWAVSAGLACIGVAGIRPLAAMLWHGAYWLTNREEPK